MTAWTTAPTFTGYPQTAAFSAPRCLACRANAHQQCANPTTAGCCCPKYFYTYTTGVNE